MIERGALWEMHLGDCTEIMPTLGMVDHVITDPPYWRHAAPRGTDRPDHPTPKPLPLMLDLVSDFTDAEETILDAFAGSGTTGVASIRLGRRFIGIEKDPTYFALACERLRAEEAGTTVQAARAGQAALFGGT
jgi:DNA modification methylase